MVDSGKMVICENGGTLHMLLGDFLLSALGVVL